MKHSMQVTLLLIGIFFLSQVIGLLVINEYLDQPILEDTGEVELSLMILISILVGTIVLLIIIKFNKVFVWKGWIFASVFITMSVSFSAFLPELIGTILAILLAYFKIFRGNAWVHNISELFIYPGLAALLVPNLGIWTALGLLIAISIYDMYAVWKSKHMVKIAKFSSKTNIFPGISIGYKKSTGTPVNKKVKHFKEGKVKQAVLGGGDIGFPLIFAGVVFKDLLAKGFLTAFLQGLIIPITASIALFLLLTKSKKNTFYPAMPFMTLGCLVGFGIVLLF